MDLSIEIKEKPQVDFVILKGWITAKNAQEFHDQSLPRLRKKHLVLDFTEVETITSSGIGILIQLIEVADEYKKRIYILRPSPVVTEVLEMTGILPLLKIIESEEEIRLKS